MCVTTLVDTCKQLEHDLMAIRYGSDVNILQEHAENETNRLEGYARQKFEKKDGYQMNILQNIFSAEDSRQVVASSTPHPISAQRITAAPHSTQLLGQFSDFSLQSLLRGR